MTMSGRPELTICSVSFNSKSCLELSWALTARLNPGAACSWIVVENSPETSSERLSLTDERFTMVEGAAVPNVPILGMRGSYHHAAGLRKALARVEGSFLLVLDPDFFIVRARWIEDVLSYMQANRLAFFGAPYFPTRVTKYRYFPTVACLFIDLRRAPVSVLDVAPDAAEVERLRDANWRALLAWSVRGVPPLGLPSRPSRRLALEVLGQRCVAALTRRVPMLRQTGCSRDVGYRLYRFARRCHLRSECLLPSWQNPLDRPAASARDRLKAPCYRWLVPDSLCPYPKRRTSTTAETFREAGLPDLNRWGWEEYFWQRAPFGFHLQGLFQGRQQASPSMIAEVLNRIGKAEDTVLV